MRGCDVSLGLIPLSLKQIFESIAEDTERKYKINVAYMEIYNEHVNDLMESNNKNLEIRESISKGIYVNRLKE